VTRPPIEMEGGNFLSDGAGRCVTTDANTWRNAAFGYTEADIKDLFRAYYGCQQTTIVPAMENEGTGHVDMSVHITAPGEVIVGKYSANDDYTNAQRLDVTAARLEASGFLVRRVGMPRNGGQTVFRSYTNALAVNGKVLVPVYAADTRFEGGDPGRIRRGIPGPGHRSDSLGRHHSNGGRGPLRDHDLREIGRCGGDIAIASHVHAVAGALAVFAQACAPGGGESAPDLGTLSDGTKGDGVMSLTARFRVDPVANGEPGTTTFSFQSWGSLELEAMQEEATAMRIQLVVESELGTRRSHRGKAPTLAVSAPRSAPVEFVVTVLNWGDKTAEGDLAVELETAAIRGLEFIANEPNCEGCSDPAGKLRARLLSAIGDAKATIDIAIYGFSDATVKDALCNAMARGVRVRAVVDDAATSPDRGTYYEQLFGENGIQSCGAEIVPVVSDGIMHQKFLIIDEGDVSAVLLAGSANFTPSAFDEEHNHMLVIHGEPELMAAYSIEFQQLFTKCNVDRFVPMSRCNECTPACVEDRNEEGPWDIADGTVSVEFAPSDDGLRTLRGATRESLTQTRDDSCDDPAANCFCSASKDKWRCTYCADGDGSWGILGEAQQSIRFSVFAATDDCFALGAARAMERGVEVTAIWDATNAASVHSQDDYLCAMGAKTYIAAWAGRPGSNFNHNKIVVADDVVFDGSMNISRSGSEENYENSLVFRSESIAFRFASYLDAEVQILEGMDITARDKAECLCAFDDALCGTAPTAFLKPGH
jgi:phosphatidylserine/phosphatidylglycerophosphate/cardiolipin synthase-like enzyme